MYRPTEAGLLAHDQWLRQPVDRRSVGRDLGVHLMRFVMAEGKLTPEEVAGFLGALRDALGVFIADMAAFVRDTPLPGRHPLLALEHGLAVHRASHDWVCTAIISLATGPDVTKDSLVPLGEH